MRSPNVAIVGILTDDIEPYRYRKDQLWGLDKAAMKKRCIDVCIQELHAADRLSESELWADRDAMHAYQAIQHARNICEAKIIQSYLSIGKFLEGLGIDIEKIPFFFSLTPNGDIRNLGNENPFLDVLSELHSSREYALLKKLLRWNCPRIIETSCPNCGESSKKIINGAIKGENKRAMRLVCSEKPKRFMNESGVDTIERGGCNHRWDLLLPSSKEELYGLLVGGFSLYFPVNSLSWVINDLSFAPSALLFTDAGFHNVNGKIQVTRGLPIGDHTDLLINMAILQHLFLENKLCPLTSGDLHRKEKLVNQAPLLIGHQHPTQLFDPALKFQTADGRLFHITDSSIFAALGHGLTSEMILDRSLNIEAFPTTQIIRDTGLWQVLNEM